MLEKPSGSLTAWRSALTCYQRSSRFYVNESEPHKSFCGKLSKALCRARMQGLAASRRRHKDQPLASEQGVRDAYSPSAVRTAMICTSARPSRGRCRSHQTLPFLIVHGSPNRADSPAIR